MVKIITLFFAIVIMVVQAPLSVAGQVQVTAHRGASGYAPENTMASFKKAVSMGADYAELDVQETKDGYIVITHDASLLRCTGVDKNIYDLTLAEVKKLNAGSWFDSSFTGEQIPELRDVIAYAKGKIKLNIELKINGHQVNLADSTVKIVKELGFADDCIFTSFDYSQLKRVKEIDSTLKTGLIFYIMPADIDIYSDENIDLLSVEQTLIDQTLMSKAKAAGREVHAWTVDTKTLMSRLIRLGVTSIITNYPDILRGLVSVDEPNEVIPSVFSISQNYPNPFNPVTTISFTVPERGNVTVKVFNTLGQEVATLVNEIKDAGNHNISWNASGLSSGTYFCNIMYNNSLYTKKMTLLK
jgi:glycerophosphoryl diester phosphodiesterase